MKSNRLKSKLFFLVLVLGWALPSMADTSIFKPVTSARRLMDVMYQNCQASQLPPYDLFKDGEIRGYDLFPTPFDNGSVSHIADLSEARKTQRYLNCTGTGENSIIDYLCEAPPTYIYDGKGSFEHRNGKVLINPFENKKAIEDIAQHAGIDCSGFINLTFALAGWRTYPNDSAEQSTAQMSAASFMKPNACFRTVQVDAGEPLHPGDILAWSTHIAMVDSIGMDPFGLKNINSPEECTVAKINPDRFDIVLIHSRGGVDRITKTDDLEVVETNPRVKSMVEQAKPKLTGVGIGIARERIQDILVSHPAVIMELAVSACLAKFGVHKKLFQISPIRHVLTEPGFSQLQLDECRLPKEESVELIGDDLICR